MEFVGAWKTSTSSLLLTSTKVESYLANCVNYIRESPGRYPLISAFRVPHD